MLDYAIKSVRRMLAEGLRYYHANGETYENVAYYRGLAEALSSMGGWRSSVQANSIRHRFERA